MTTPSDSQKPDTKKDEGKKPDTAVSQRLTAFRASVRENLIPTNTLLAFCTSLIGLADVMAPRVVPLLTWLRNGVLLVVAVLVFEWLLPQRMGRAFDALRARWWPRAASPVPVPEAADDAPARRLRLLIPAVLIAVGFSLTLSKANAGGVLASQSPTLRTLQAQLLGLSADVQRVGATVERSNAILETMAQRDQQAAAAPIALGLLDLQANGMAVSPDAALPLRLAVHLNAADADFGQADLLLASGVADQGPRQVQNLKAGLGHGVGPGAVQLLINLPAGTRWASACLLLPAASNAPGAVARALVQRWRVGAANAGPQIETAAALRLTTAEDPACAR